MLNQQHGGSDMFIHCCLQVATSSCVGPRTETSGSFEPCNRKMHRGDRPSCIAWKGSHRAAFAHGIMAGETVLPMLYYPRRIGGCGWSWASTARWDRGATIRASCATWAALDGHGVRITMDSWGWWRCWWCWGRADVTVGLEIRLSAVLGLQNDRMLTSTQQTVSGTLRLCL